MYVALEMKSRIVMGKTLSQRTRLRRRATREFMKREANSKAVHRRKKKMRKIIAREAIIL